MRFRLMHFGRLPRCNWNVGLKLSFSNWWKSSTKHPCLIVYHASTMTLSKHKMRFGQYQASSAVLGWLGDGENISFTKWNEVRWFLYSTYLLMMSLASLDTSVKLTSGNLKRVYTPGGRGRNVHWSGIIYYTIQVQWHVYNTLLLEWNLCIGILYTDSNLDICLRGSSSSRLYHQIMLGCLSLPSKEQ